MRTIVLLCLCALALNAVAVEKDELSRLLGKKNGASTNKIL